jgi:hypothetical protein
MQATDRAHACKQRTGHAKQFKARDDKGNNEGHSDSIQNENATNSCRSAHLKRASGVHYGMRGVGHMGGHDNLGSTLADNCHVWSSNNNTEI